MIDINFLTPEYKFKLMFKNLTKIAAIVIVLIFAVLMGVNTYLTGIIKNKNAEIASLNSKIKKTKDETIEVRQKMKEIPDLTNSIQIVEDIFKQQNLRISEILYVLQEEIPSGISLYNLNYDGQNISFSGRANQNTTLKLNSYENVFQFERNLKNSNKFVNIKADYIRRISVGKYEVSEFQYDMRLTIE